MQVIAEIAPLREQVLQWRREGQRIAFVPTMGHLHDGHLTLVRRARENADVVVVSIFVNPMQFDKADDLAAYPRTLDEDIAKLNCEGVELVFTPTAEVMYPKGMDNHTFVDVPGVSGVLEGASRPGHFRGVATVVSKLFNMVQPDVACFGEKDFQQLAVIRKMVEDLCLPIEIISVATVREMDGLAMSSRNSRLTVDERQRAPVLAKTLRWISSQMRGGRNDYSELVLDGNDQLRAAGLEPDEIFIRDAHTLQAITEHTSKAVILASAFLGQVRLIDNLTVDLTPQVSDDSEE
ncbi:pantoate--beta-alanine ligase [Grimontia hollisae]|uniref:Pantothenate synthetase n=2 Tax=Grimontia hollisae TaxID=673 RepID=D0I4T4_GRIHO|nr:pantoate--beta-alanine ligase [Grimontia hollisae]AUW37806.1 pantoate--beta-alanine ligase [Grimontia hollisae]EEY73501.1 pantoate--beta-alanine ligase [Grimontia hollisae CIP 101886]MDF2183301.1 pantoate--beta-alanine ligase [Grimontia hollisae]STO42494.1 Pantothenate synthetase [Grimontia hollisae]STO56429.1 Pantothenate synthetase [Grimontia hollisae]